MKTTTNGVRFFTGLKRCQNKLRAPHHVKALLNDYTITEFSLGHYCIRHYFQEKKLKLIVGAIPGILIFAYFSASSL